MRLWSIRVFQILTLLFVVSSPLAAQTADVSIFSHTDNPDPITLGQGNITYTITITTSANATNVTLTDTIPASSTFVSASIQSGTGSCLPTVPTCTWPSVTTGQFVTAQVIVTPGSAGTNTNTAVVSANETDPTPANNTLSQSTTVNGQIDVAVFSQTDNPDPITLGQGNVSYAVTIQNLSSSAASAVVISDTVPANSTFVSATNNSGAGGTCDAAPTAGVVKCQWPFISAGQFLTATFVFTPTAGGTLTNNVSVSAFEPDPNSANNTSSVNTTVNAQIDVAIFSQTDNPDPITLGQGNVSYAVTIQNLSSSAASAVVISDTVPANSTFVSATNNSGAGGTCDAAPTAGVVKCQWPFISAGQFLTATFVFTPTAGGTLTNNVSVGAFEPDPNSANNTSSANTTVNAQIDVAIFSQTDNPDPITLGQGNVSYAVTIQNLSTSAASAVVISDTVPANSTFVSATNNSGAGGTCDAAPTAGVVKCQWPFITAGQFLTATFVFTPTAGGTLTNNVSVSASEPDPNSANNTSSVNTTVNAQIDVAIFSQTDSPDPITLGQGNVSYAVTIQNLSSSAASAVVISDTVPANSTFVSATNNSGAGGTCDTAPTAGVVKCQWPFISAGQFLTATFIFTPTAGGTLTNNVSVSAFEPDPNSSNNTSSVNTTVNAQIDVAMFSHTDSPDPIAFGSGNVSYAVTIQNLSSSAASAVVISDTVPANSTFVSATNNSGAGGTCDAAPTAGVVKCQWPFISAGQFLTATFVFTPTAPGTLNNFATVSAAEPDPNAANNSLSAQTTVNPTAAPVITSFTPTSGLAGTAVVISGSNFTGTTSVKFGSVVASFAVLNDTTINTTVPAGAVSAPISVTNAIGTGTTGTQFLVQSSSCTAPPSSLVSWWRAEGNAIDSEGANSGTPQGPVAFVAGKVGQAFSLNGFSSYVNVTDASSLHQPTLTIEAWVNFATVVKSAILSKPIASTAYNSFAMWYDPATSELLATVGSFTSANADTVGFVWTPTLGAWNHVAFTYDGSTEVLYLNGVAMASRPATVAISYDSSPLLIGADIDNGSTLMIFNGKIDEPSFYDRALSAAEVQSIYDAGTLGKCFAPPPAPTISEVRYGSGSIAGGQNVDIYGANLDTVNQVTIGGGIAPIYYQRGDLVRVTAPAHAAGSVPLIVTNAGGSATSSYTYNNFYDLGLDFPISANPGGPWSFGYTQGRFGTPMTLYNTMTNNSGYDIWTGGPQPQGPAHNNTIGNLNLFSWSIPQGKVGCHPGPSGENCVSRWTAPVSGQFEISGSFSGADYSGPTSTDNAVLINGTEMFSTNVLDYNVPHPFTIRKALNAGDKVDFTVGWYNGSQAFDETVVDARITPLTPVTITLISPNSGPANGGTTVTITGSNFHAGANVIFGNRPATSVTVVNATTITAVTPVHPMGAVDVTITHPDSADITASGGFTYVAPVCVTAPSGLLTWYRAENNALDSVGPNWGTTQGAMFYSPAKVGQGFTFANNLDGVQAAHNTTLDMNPGGFTVEFWMRGDHTQPDTYFDLVEKSHGFIDSTGWAVQGISASGNVGFLVGNGGPGASNFPTAQSAVDVLDNVFHHIAATWDGSTLFLYIDGTLQASAPSGLPVNNTRPLNIGFASGGGTPNRFFRGVVDEVGIYGRALSAAEIQTIFNADAAGKCFTPPPAPQITGFSPASGPIGTAVTISGSNFTIVHAVKFNGINAPYTFVSDSQLSATVPTGATTGPISVSNISATATSSANFTVTSGFTADLGVSVSATPQVVPTGGSFVYFITVTNLGPDTANGLSLTLNVPPAATRVRFVDAGWSCTGTTTIVCTIPSHTTGSPSTFELDMTAPATPTILTLSASVTSSDTDPDPVNNNSSANVVVRAPVSNFVVTSPADSGPNTLRDAIDAANGGLCGPVCTITFAIPPAALVPIAPRTPFNGINSAVIIDGTSQPGIVIDGVSCATCDGFSLNRAASTIKGLIVTRFATALALRTNGHMVQGMTFDGNTIAIEIRSSNNTIGGTTAAERNVLTRNANGVVLQQAPATANKIVGNYIGVAADGVTPAGNGSPIILDTPATGNIVGGRIPGAGNIIANNSNPGVNISGVGNIVAGNITYANGSGLGIDLGNNGATADDPGDSDTPGGNNFQNHGAISSALVRSGSVQASISVDSSAVASTGSLFVDLYRTDAAGNVRSFLGGQCVGGNSLSNTTISAPAGTVVNGDYIAATVTSFSDAGCNTVNDGTSEFGAPAAAVICVPPTITASGPTTFCAGGTVTLTASAGISYLWSTGATTQSIAVSSTGNYSVTVFDSAGCNLTSAATTVTVTPRPAPVITASGPTTFCNGGSVTLTAPAGMASYLWNTGATTQSITVTAPGSFTVTVTDTNSCSGTSSPVTVNVISPPTATITASGSTNICPGSSVTLNATGGMSSYLWSNGMTTPSIVVNAAGSYTVTVTNAGGCSATSSPTTVNVLPPPSVSISGTNFVCGNGTVTLDAGSGFATYLWNTGDTTQTITTAISSTTTFTVSVTDASGCSATASHVVTVGAQPPSAITAPASVCPGGTGSASVPFTNGATYNWTITNGTIASGSGTNAITFTPAGTAPVTLSASVTAGSCSSASSATVNVSSTVSVAITGPAQICAGTRVTLDAGAGHLSYLWSNGATTQSISIILNSTATFSVDVTDSGGCSGSASKTVTVTPPPNATISAPSTVDANSTGNTAGVSPSPNANYNWSIGGGTITNGQGTPDITFTAGPNGPVVLTVAVSSGTCSVTRSVNINVNALVCSTNPPTLISPADQATGVTSPTTFAWNGITGAISYDVFIVPDGGSPSLLGSTTTATSLTAAVAAGKMSWYVVAHLAQQCSPSFLTSATRTFTAAQSSSCSGLPPVIKSPVGGTQFSPVTFTWLPSAGAIAYRLRFQVGGGAAQDVDTADTTAVVLISDSGVVTWSVAAIFSGCPPVFSSPVTFTLEKEDCSKHTAASLLAPSQNTTLASSSVDFEWSAVAGAAGYRVWTRTDNAAASALGDTVDTKMRKEINAGAIDWYVETLFNGCPSTFSDTQHFNVPRAANCGTEVPALLAPSNGATVNGALVSFSWGAVPGAISYELHLSAANGTPALLGTTTATTLNREVPPSLDLEWFVTVNVNGCPQRVSATRRLRYETPANCASGRTTLTAPADDASGVTSPLTMRWTNVVGAKSYVVWLVKGDPGNGSASAPQVIGRPTGTTLDNVAVGNGAYRWFVDAVFDTGCAISRSTASRFVVVTTPQACTPLPAPNVSVPSQASSGTQFKVRWNTLPGASSYILQESTQPNFATSTVFTTSTNEATFSHPNSGANAVMYFYRVRGIDTRCSPPEQSPYSSAAAVSVLPAVNTTPNNQPVEGATSVGETAEVEYTIPIGSEHAGEAFTATPTRPWINVSPASGVVGPNGTTVHVFVSTTNLPVGTSLGGVTLSFPTTSNGRLTTHGGGSTIVPISISIATPVSPTPKSGPPPDALIIPAVAHADGFNSKFESDVRVTNTSPQVMKYQLTFTPSGDAGISEGRQAQIDVDPGRTIALDDVLRTWFATGTTNATGTLEIRPLTQAANATTSTSVKGLANFVTFASSRTFNVTSNGTFGQFIPAVPFANFVGGATGNAKSTVLSLQQIAQSAAYRTNLGFVEGSGQPVSLMVNVFGDHGELLTAFPVDLNGGQHLQLNGFLSQRNIQVNDGRVEVNVVGGTGKITAYASVLDNRTSDPLLVTPITIGDTSSSKYVLPGVAQFSAGTGWQTDARLFNAGDTTVNATLTFQSLTGAEPRSVKMSIEPKKVLQLDRTLETLYGITNDGGAIGITTDSPSNLIATARTFRPDAASGGTFGQFIQAVTPNEAVKLGSRPLQILQVEESARFRSNIGLAEVSGQATTVEVTAIPPDSKISATIQVNLAPNQFTQLDSLLGRMGLADTHNARVSVKVVDGTGSVTAYASVIDLETQDPTFVPAQ